MALNLFFFSFVERQGPPKLSHAPVSPETATLWSSEATWGEAGRSENLESHLRVSSSAQTLQGLPLSFTVTPSLLAPGFFTKTHARTPPSAPASQVLPHSAGLCCPEL